MPDRASQPQDSAEASRGSVLRIPPDNHEMQEMRKRVSVRLPAQELQKETLNLGVRVYTLPCGEQTVWTTVLGQNRPLPSNNAQAHGKVAEG